MPHGGARRWTVPKTCTTVNHKSTLLFPQSTRRTLPTSVQSMHHVVSQHHPVGSLQITDHAGALLFFFCLLDHHHHHLQARVSIARYLKSQLQAPLPCRRCCSLLSSMY